MNSTDNMFGGMSVFIGNGSKNIIVYPGKIACRGVLQGTSVKFIAFKF